LRAWRLILPALRFPIMTRIAAAMGTIVLYAG
jgi:hypothetical protein